jgi:N-acetyl-gamma-glutamyl-phosphate reductase
MVYQVFVDGLEGTTGLQIRERLDRHQHVHLLEIDPALRKDLKERQRLLNAADVVFLCLPDAAAKEAVSLIENPSTRIIDPSSAHRVDESWTFGLPELNATQKQAIAQSKRVSNPGCHSTGFILSIAPLVAAGLVPASLALSCHSLTGYSGGGKKLIAAHEQAGAAWNGPRPYALNMVHKHQPEMRKYCGLTHTPIFMPIVGNVYKGMMTNVPLSLSALKPGTQAQDIHACLSEHYRGQTFVKVMPTGDTLMQTLEDGFFNIEACNDTNRVELFVFSGPDSVLLSARFDNLGKGASGASIQNMNIMLGIEEGHSLVA